MAVRTILLCLLAAACTSWRTQPLAPERIVSEMHPKRVRVTLTDSSVLMLQHPVIFGDSIVGMVAGTRTAVAPDRIGRTEVRFQNYWKTFGFVSLYAVLYFALCRGTPDCPSAPPPGSS